MTMLRYFLAVVQWKSLFKVAVALIVSQSALSKQMQTFSYVEAID